MFSINIPLPGEAIGIFVGGASQREAEANNIQAVVASVEKEGLTRQPDRNFALYLTWLLAYGAVGLLLLPTRPELNATPPISAAS